MRQLPLHIKIIIGLLLGIIWSFVSSFLGWNDFTINWVAPFGTIFIRSLKFVAVPLVLFSIISGIAGLTDISKLGRVAAKTLGLYLLTTVLAITIGLLLVNAITPGSYASEEQLIKNRLSYEVWLKNTLDTAPKDGKNYLTNPAYSKYANAMHIQENDADVTKKIENANMAKENSPLKFLVDMVPENLFLSFSNNKLMLQVISFAIFFGICLGLSKSEEAVLIKKLINGLNEIFLKMIDFIMRVAPFFVFALLAGVVAKMADTPQGVYEIFKGLSVYVLTVIGGLGIMVFIIYPSIILLVVKKLSYKDFFKAISPAQLLAFSTSSSAATLPVTMDCVQDNLKVPKRVTSFVLPIGATVNMDGTSLYLAVVAIFLAQFHLIDLTIADQLMIVLTATLSSIGTAAVPSAGLVMLVAILQTVGLNPAWMAIIFPVDRILDMCRTVVNVTGDATVSTLVAASEGELKIKSD